MTTSRVSWPHVSRVKPVPPANAVIVQIVQIGLNARSVTVAVDRRVVVSAMTSVHRVDPVRTSLSV